VLCFTASWLLLTFLHLVAGPMFGQFGHFTKYAPEKVPYAINRYTTGAGNITQHAPCMLAKKH
jgi:hypothetical protein